MNCKSKQVIYQKYYKNWFLDLLIDLKNPWNFSECYKFVIEFENFD